MKNLFNPRRFASFSVAQKTGSRLSEVRLVAASTLLLAAITVFTQVASQAQGSYVPSKVSNVSAQPSASGTLVSSAADSRLSRPQSWQGQRRLPFGTFQYRRRQFTGGGARSKSSWRRQLAGSAPANQTGLTGESAAGDGNHSDLVVDQKLDVSPLDRYSRYEPNSSEEQQLFKDSQQPGQGPHESTPLKFSTPVEDLSSNSRVSTGETAHTASNWISPMGQVSILQPAAFQKQTAATPESAASHVGVQVEDEGLAASIFSGTSVFVVVSLGLFGLLVSRKLRSREVVEHTAETSSSEDAEWVEDQTAGRTAAEARGAQKGNVSSSLVKSNGPDASNGSSRQAVARIPVTGPTSHYGAYRIDQEVGKLILGQPHRMDVLASRAIDDRRAIETSLFKAVNALDLDESARRRAREALEEYGFVARQCAALLLSPDPFDRSSAARRLGEIKSESALPFLLEGLYDSESIVRNQAVVSIGELKLPSAIGALLDIARTHPDVPCGLLSRTLSACSVEGLDLLDALIPEPALLGIGQDASTVEQITHLEPSSSVEELQEGSDDEQLAQALLLQESGDVHERSKALKTLAQFRVHASVRALALAARQDFEPNNRSMAISSLGSIDHESVFPAILIGMADDAREVRASAARALNRLSFDRADAYVRVIETGDEDTVRGVARACIQAGIVSQNLDRLASSGHRQAYETFSLICLLAKANMNDPILDAIAVHPNMDVRLRAVHLLASTGQPGTSEQLRQLAVRDGVCEEVKTALLEAMYKLEETKPPAKETAAAADADSEPQSVMPEAETVAGSGFGFEFTPTSQQEIQPQFGVEHESKVDELES